MKQYTQALGKIINGLKGRTNVGKEELTRELAAYTSLLMDLVSNNAAYSGSLGRYQQDIVRINNNLNEGRTETAFLSLMISTGSLSAFLGTVLDYVEPRSSR